MRISVGSQRRRDGRRERREVKGRGKEKEGEVNEHNNPVSIVLRSIYIGRPSNPSSESSTVPLTSQERKMRTEFEAILSGR